jgi:hypothetical protein
MAILKTVELAWHGKPYSVDVTMALINRIEDDVNLMKLAQRIGRNDPPLSHIAVVFSHLLRAAGCKEQCTPEEVWAGMFADGENTTAQDVISAASLALRCVFPDVNIRRRADPKPQTRSKSTRGRKSTG